ncbi:hypothetical protein IWQ61_010254 [Dispira simplex]|nr:hypothetical protein IWQ61_010254 [Dispira simplex]
MNKFAIAFALLLATAAALPRPDSTDVVAFNKDSKPQTGEADGKDAISDAREAKNVNDKTNENNAVTDKQPKDGENTGDEKPKDGKNTGNKKPEDGEKAGNMKPKDGENTGDKKPEDGKKAKGDQKPKDGENTGDKKPKDGKENAENGKKTNSAPAPAFHFAAITAIVVALSAYSMA